MNDLAWLKSEWTEIARQIYVGKLHQEPHRDLVVVDSRVLETANVFFAEQGDKTPDGLTLTISEPLNFQTFDTATIVRTGDAYGLSDSPGLGWSE